MKKFAVCTLLLSLLTFCLFGCSSEPKHFSGEWKFAEISKVELIPNPYSSDIEALKQIYGAQDEAGIIAGAFNAFVADQTFNSCNIRFEKDRVYTYDPLLEREATWVFYQTGDNVGFLSFFTELDADEGNPDPVICPDLVYDADDEVMSIRVNYSSFLVTLNMTR